MNPDHPNDGDDRVRVCPSCSRSGPFLDGVCKCGEVIEDRCGYWKTPQTRMTKCGGCPTCEEWGVNEQHSRLEDE
jgi:hypothetical protein